MAPADATRFLIALGLPPLLWFRIDPSQVWPPWAFALDPGWSAGQLVVTGFVGAVLGFTASRPMTGLAAATSGVLGGLAIDLWRLASQVTPSDQSFVTMLGQDAWRSRAVGQAIALASAIAVGSVAGAALRWLTRRRPAGSLRRPNRLETTAIGIAVIGSPLLALGIASAFAGSALVVPDGAQVQTVSVLGDGISMSPVALRAGPVHVRCRFAVEARADWARLVVAPPIGGFGSGLEALEEFSTCGPWPDGEAWGSVAEVRPGRYVWIQWDPNVQPPRLTATSPEFVVRP